MDGLQGTYYPLFMSANRGWGIELVSFFLLLFLLLLNMWLT